MKTAKMLTILEPRISRILLFDFLFSHRNLCNLWLILVLVLGLMVCPTKVSGQVELGTAFTYQGFLKDLKNDKPADVPHDFQFGLFNDFNDLDPNIGVQVGSTFEANDVNVIDGYFMVRLDFGADVFTGYERWLQIAVRETDSGKPFTDLAPRLELTLTPYAIYALSAGDANTLDGYDANDFTPTGHSHHSFDAADGSPTNVLYVDNAGNVGIGTTSPTEKLNVVGNALIGGTLTVTGEQEVDGGVAADGFTAGDTTHYGHGVVRTTGEVPNDDLMFSVGGSSSPATRNSRTEGAEIMRLTEAGNLGIGTPNPSERLHVAGSVRIVDGTQGEGRVLTSNASGVASWLAPQLPPGSGVPSGVIVMWAGAIGDIPEDWALCDGTNGTPNLRDRFIVGAGGEYSVDNTGGEKMHTLTTAEMPSHTHEESGHGGWPGCACGGDPVGHYKQVQTGPAGDNQPHENRPPFYALAYIMRLP